MGQDQSKAGAKGKKPNGSSSQKKNQELFSNVLNEQMDKQYQSASQRLKDDLPRLKVIFKEHITNSQSTQDQHYAFRKLLFQWYYMVNGFNVSDYKAQEFKRIASTLYTLYIPTDQSQMKFENFVCLYDTLVSKDPEEQFNLVFRFFAENPPEYDEEQKEQYVHAGRFQSQGMLQLGIYRDHAADFFTQSLNITSNIKIYKSKMREYFDIFRQDPYFNWVDYLYVSFKGLENAQALDKSMTLLDKQQLNYESGDFTKEEYKALDDFFENKIAKHTDLMKASDEFSGLISDRSIDIKFRNRLIEGFLYGSDSSLYYDKKVYFRNMRLMFKERDDLVLINFIFDIFTKYSKEGIMNQTAIQECFQVFRKQSQDNSPQKKNNGGRSNLIDTSSTPGGDDLNDEELLDQALKNIKQINRSTFVEMYAQYLDHKTQFQKLRTVLYVELGVRPESGAMERKIIKSILDGGLTFKDYILKHMQRGDGLFLVNKKFIDQWVIYSKSTSTIDIPLITESYFVETRKDKESNLKIDNQSLFKEKKDKEKLVSLRLNENVVAIPPRIWNAFTQWYGRTDIIKRKVIEYPNTPENRANQSPHNLRKLSSDKKIVTELEIELLMIRAAQLQDNGSYPESMFITYVSPKQTLNDVKLQLCRIFQVKNPEMTQLWMKEELLQGDEVLQSSVEQNKQIKDGMKFYIEKILENGRWPTEEKRIKKAQKTNINEMRTVGCYNLGNTCYMNSVIQCVANTHYFKDYFLRHIFFESKDFKIPDSIEGSDWKFIPSKADLVYDNQINITNPMGFEGRIVTPFAKLIEDMFTSKFACVKEPAKFKSAIGKSFEQFSTREQQDAQEFLVILLDSLHEELNIRMSKPYIEKPSSQSRDQEELAVQCWSNFLQRNWSFILFLFFGQMRSFLKCVECNKERISFDEYSTLSLPLPESSLINMKIVIQLLPSEIKQILVQGHEFSQILDDELEKQRRKQTLNFDLHEQNIHILTKERLITFQVSLSPATQMTELSKYLAQTFKNLNLILPPHRKATLEEYPIELVYYLQDYQDGVEIIIPPETSLQQIREGTTISVCELLTAHGKQLIQDYYSTNWSTIIKKHGNVLLNFYPNRDASGNPQLELDEDINEQIMIMNQIQTAAQQKVDSQPLQPQIQSSTDQTLLDQIEQAAMNPLDQVHTDDNKIQFPEQTEIHNEEIKLVSEEVQNFDQINNLQEVLDCEPAEFPEQDSSQDLFKVKPPQPIDGFQIIVQEEQIDTRSQKQPSDDFFQAKRQGRSGVQLPDDLSFNEPKKTISAETHYYEMSKYQLRRPGNIGYSQFMTQLKQNQSKGLQFEIRYEQPKEFLIYLIQRKLVAREVFLTPPNKYRTQTFGQPFLIMVNPETNGRQLYEETWMRTRFMLNLTNQKFFEKPKNLWWNKYSSTKELPSEMKQFQPFVLKFVQSQNNNHQQCSICPISDRQTEYCFGCVLEPSTKSKELLSRLKSNSIIAVEWNFDFLQQYYNEAFLQPMQIDTLKDTNVSEHLDVQLTDCLKMFEQKEEIPVKEGVKCDQCHRVTHHQRKMGVQKAPPILIIHLKRFKIINGNKRKIDQEVKYPLYDLDMSPFLYGHDQLNQSQDHKYDLFGVINHYGSINGGHYTCVIKNERTNSWLSYDDSYVKEVQESKVRSPFAYILFYKRRDIMKQPLEKIYPSISMTSDQPFFRGKPVRFKKKYGQKLLGYLWDVKVNEQGQKIYHVKIDAMDFFTTLDMFDEEGDKDNISHLQSMRNQQQQDESSDEEDKKDNSKEQLNKKKSTIKDGGNVKKKTKNCAQQ